jgi:hypothetical protein
MFIPLVLVLIIVAALLRANHRQETLVDRVVKELNISEEYVM